MKALHLALAFLALSCAREHSVPVSHLVPEHLGEKSLTLGHVSRMGFESSTGREWRLRFRAPTQPSWLKVSWGVPPGPRSDVVVPVGVAITLRETAADSQAIVRDRVGSDRWREKTVPLSQYAGRDLELILAAHTHDPSQEGVVWWGTPIVATNDRERPNILLICIDSLRADHLGCYGYERRTSPTIDSLASRGCMFTRAVAQSSWTVPSHASLFTSLYCRSHGASTVTAGLKPGIPTLTGLLRRAGYLTGAIVSGGAIDPAYNLDQGFDEFDARLGSSGPMDVTAPGTHYRDVTAPWTHYRAVQWLSKWGQHSPFFLFIHYWDVHLDYAPPAPYDRLFDSDYRGILNALGFSQRELGEAGLLTPRDLRRLVALYDGEIAHTDRYIGLLLRHLRRLGLAENTTVILISDHGDEFMEHGGVGHGRSVFQEVIHVPLLWAEPSRTEEPCVVHEPVGLVDVTPTILEFVGVDAPPGMEGASFLGLMRGQKPLPRTIFSEVVPARVIDGGFKSVLRRDSKLIIPWNDSTPQAYDLATDPAEQVPLTPERIHGGNELKELLASFAARDTSASVTLEVRTAGTGPRGAFALTIRSAWLAGVSPWKVEADDSLEVAPDLAYVILKPDCRSDDVDGLSLELLSPEGGILVDAVYEENAMPPRWVFLGTGQHPRGVPFAVRGVESRLQAGPGGPPDSLCASPGLFLWADLARAASVVPAQLDERLQERLRALGYLE